MNPTSVAPMLHATSDAILIAIPDSITKLQNLKDLYLSGTDITGE